MSCTVIDFFETSNTDSIFLVFFVTNQGWVGICLRIINNSHDLKQYLPKFTGIEGDLYLNRWLAGRFNTFLTQEIGLFDLKYWVKWI